MENLPTPPEILTFWFQELTPKQHFKKDKKLDALIFSRFHLLHHNLTSSLYPFANTLEGKQAAILVFDQFARNMYRDTKKAYENDRKALKLAKEIVSSRKDTTMPEIERSFIYMPFMHCENLEVQVESVKLFSTLNDKSNLHYAKLHYDIIKRFKRFPHRNKALNRKSTPEEITFIETPGTAF